MYEFHVIRGIQFKELTPKTTIVLLGASMMYLVMCYLSKLFLNVVSIVTLSTLLYMYLQFYINVYDDKHYITVIIDT